MIRFYCRDSQSIGGMEMHARYFIQHFSGHSRFPLVGGEPQIVFFNSGHWIEELSSIRQRHPTALFVYRTGGNEILKAALSNAKVPSHRQRQIFWVSQLNEHIDCLITNSAYTEQRLRNLGLTCPMKRCVGGVNALALHRPLKLFCASRFVSYKNPAVLVSIVNELVKRGFDVSLRFAGDGPLFDQVASCAAGPITFLGAIDHLEVCREMAAADVYIQMSFDCEVSVEGGFYVHAEGMGRSILEALSAGLYIIAGRCGALEEIVTQDRGRLIEYGGIEYMVDQVAEALTDHFFSQRYSWAGLFKQYEELFDAFFTCH